MSAPYRLSGSQIIGPDGNHRVDVHGMATEEGRVLAAGILAMMNGEPVVRELMLALEIARVTCEHAEGKNQTEAKRLRLAMRVAIRTLSKHRSQVVDYQRESWWDAVRAFPAQVDPTPAREHEWELVMRGVGYERYRCRHCCADRFGDESGPELCLTPRVERVKKKKR